MKFRIVWTVVLLVVLAVAYFVFEADQTTQPSQQPDNGLVLH